MVNEIKTANINGIDSRIITVETDISSGLPGMEIIGSLSPEVKESKERVRVALKNNGINFPACRITINLSPADIRKEGTSFDLPIAVSLLVGMGVVTDCNVKELFYAGEIGLDGEIKHIKGILPMVLEAKNNGFGDCIIPESNVNEAAIVEGIRIIGVNHISEVINYLNYPVELRDGYISPTKHKITLGTDNDNEIDFMDVCGQESVKRAMEIAASGFHNLMMIGPPGGGKSMMAKRLPTILPPLTMDECLEVSKIYSVCGLLNNENNIISKRPFLSPHHSITQSAMTGGGKNPSPGIVSKAHKGVLFLDEIVHFPINTLEVLRQPIEDKKIHVVRTNWNYIFPADFMLVAAMNPCPCGYFPDRNKCNCSNDQIRKYIGKISGPILDRFDMCIETGRIDIKDTGNRNGRDSKSIRDNVLKAIEIQKKRYDGTNILFNSQLSAKEIDNYIRLGHAEKSFVEEMYHKLNLSVRGYHRILRVSRTIADIDNSIDIEKEHLMEAICYRSVEDKFWGSM